MSGKTVFSITIPSDSVSRRAALEPIQCAAALSAIYLISASRSSLVRTYPAQGEGGCLQKLPNRFLLPHARQMVSGINQKSFLLLKASP
jgi:hypothetical protein